MSTDNSMLEQSGSMPFRPRARLIRLLGEELISDEVMAIVELVKNGYDADARKVLVVLDDVTKPETGVIRIRDNGYGMDLHTALHSWMEPATHHKRARGGSKIRTPLGRVQLGEKGVGRFAADKLGCELELITRRTGHEEVVLQVSWHHFDHDRYLDEVVNTWSVREPVEFPGDEHGTLLLIRSLRSTWDQGMVDRLYNGLMRLVSPSANTQEFLIDVESPEFPLASGRIINRLVETAPYRLAGEVSEEGLLNTGSGDESTIDLRPLCQGHFVQPDGTLRAPCCGPFTIALNIWDLEPITGNGFGVDRPLREAIKATSGVSIYRDGFRIWPYGEKDDDWLELNQRRVNNPTLRISNNQVIGFVEITHAGNPELKDRTSREGLLDTPAFFDVRALVLAAVSVLETERFARRRPATSERPGTTEADDDEVLQWLFKVRDSTKSGTNGAGSALREMERVYRKRLEEERNRYEQVSRLAGTGMAAELLTNSFSRQMLNAETIARTLQGMARRGANAEIKQLVESLMERLEAVSTQLDIMAPLYRVDERDAEPVSLRGAAYDVVSVMADRLAEAGATVRLEGDTRPAVRMSRGHLMQVLMILIENAIGSLRDLTAGDREILIEVMDQEEGRYGLRVSDSGSGVTAGTEKLIFMPYFSTRHAGRGLGLHVARDVLALYNSTLEFAGNGTMLSGACFQIRFDGRRTPKGRIL